MSNRSGDRPFPVVAVLPLRAREKFGGPFKYSHREGMSPDVIMSGR